MPDTRSELWNIATGIRVLFSDTTQLAALSTVLSKNEVGSGVHSSEQASDANLSSFLDCEPEIQIN